MGGDPGMLKKFGDANIAQPPQQSEYVKGDAAPTTIASNSLEQHCRCLTQSLCRRIGDRMIN
jgi:hypothetical protein